jgi:hypothetical protein
LIAQRQVGEDRDEEVRLPAIGAALGYAIYFLRKSVFAPLRFVPEVVVEALDEDLLVSASHAGAVHLQALVAGGVETYRYGDSAMQPPR